MCWALPVLSNLPDEMRWELLLSYYTAEEVEIELGK
jgi:hypothetical protein